MVQNQTMMAVYTLQGMDNTILGSQVASKAFRIVCDARLGKPYVFPLGRNPARDDDDIEGRGCDKKRKSACNGQNRGSNLPQPEKELTYHWYLIV